MLDYAVHWFAAEERDVGISAGVGIAMEFPLLTGSGGMPLVSLRPRVGLGFEYVMADLSLLSPRLGKVRLHGGLTLKNIGQDFGTYNWGLKTEIVQKHEADYLFAGGGIELDRGGSSIELQVRTSLRRIVVTGGASWYNSAPPPPTGFTTFQLSWGWRW
jgi:hypothetical protein